MANSQPVQDLAQYAVATAQQLGAQAAAAAANHVREVEVAWRDGKLERLTEAGSRGLSVELYVDGRYAAVATSDTRREAVAAFLADAVEMTRALSADLHRKLADPLRYAKPGVALSPDACGLQLADPSYAELSAVERKHIAEAIESAARSQDPDGRILSVSSGVSDSQSEVYRCDSQGFSGWRRGTSFWWSGEVSVLDPDGRRPEGGDYRGGRFRSDLGDFLEVGRSASRRTLARIGAKKPPTATGTIVIDHRVAGRMLSSLLGPLSGAALQQQRSFFQGREGSKVGSDLLDLVDDPLVVRGLGSRLFDSEGVAAQKMPLFERGFQRGLYIDTYYGSKLGRSPTSGGASNLAWTLGNLDQPGLLAQVGDGVLVTGFLGGNSNGTTGDFSFGIQGFAIRNGQIAEPLAEMNIAGNHMEFWQRLVAVGNDPYPYSALRTPTLVFEGVTVAGGS